jgi:exodeoxyribonuclease VII large subunit
LKTPTAVAEFLISRYRLADERINELSLALFEIVSGKVRTEKDRLNRFILLLKPSVKEQLMSRNGELRYMGMNLTGSVNRLLIRESEAIIRKHTHFKTAAKEFFISKKHALELMEKSKKYLDPFLILRRGYSITYYKGRALKNALHVSRGEIIETRLAEGTISSKTS